MNNTASILVLLFLAVTFVQSAYDKIFGWQGNIDWLKGHFANTSLLKNNVPLCFVLRQAACVVRAASDPCKRN